MGRGRLVAGFRGVLVDIRPPFIESIISYTYVEVPTLVFLIEESIMISIKYMNNEENYKNWLLNKYIISGEKRILTNKNKTFFYNANLMAEKCYIKMNFV